jgi:lysyl-tRNA synthetase class I
MHQINVVDIHLPPTSGSLPLPFPHISTLAQATDLSEEDISAISTTDTNIDDYILAPQSAQAKVNDSRLLKVFQWLQDLRQLDSLSDTQPSCGIVRISSWMTIDYGIKTLMALTN